MELALKEAAKAAAQGEVPVGAVAVFGNELLACDHNRSIQLHDPTAHAELLVLRQVGKLLSNYRLNNVDIYVTLEPCSMCAGALIWARVRRVVFGTRDEKAGALVSKVSLLEPGLFNHEVQVVEGLLERDCRAIIQNFFFNRRN